MGTTITLQSKQASIYLLFLSVSIFIHLTSMAQGLVEGQMVRSSQIGSRPPSCRGRCKACGGRCEAVQVPVAALRDSSSHQNQRKRRTTHFSALSSEDETSNYKPISWKCKWKGGDWMDG
ncbi:EPIDERMAL PATTERNING FACTOR-like protein 2 [Cucurbita pepo subsp. pepo]|uniref:EPIDERMAL PATTERNING FACTOR-like protein 2 n=1 Tax=Cucurbita pepo subsp. pepo TaxID=3664 RepID=UPI000C9D8C18|nr:EPIDERMAL PATTERNING FACTOR-like protein 2 [Cucurbita pepo subsp. pepo]